MERRETSIGAPALATVAQALDDLDDEDLRAIIARAQGLLLDRPDPLAGCPRLAVEIVGDAEGDLLAAYRALVPSVQRGALAAVRHLAREARVPYAASPPPCCAEEGKRRMEEATHADRT